MSNVNKLLNLCAVVTISAISSNAIAQHNEHNIKNNFFYTTAKVINVEPIVKNIQITTPKRECWEEQVFRPVYKNHDQANVLFGGLVGGIVGNQFGQGDGKKAATVVGSIIGAAVGNNIVQKNHNTSRSERVDVERHCKVTQTTHSEQRVEGYWVSYRYKGEMFTTRMNDEPGKRLKVRVQITPVLN